MKKILVVGETCTDVFMYCESDRLAPDIPVPVLKVKEKKTMLGMAANVKRNIKSLGMDCDSIESGGRMRKTRYVHDKTNHMFFRVDEADSVPRGNAYQIAKQAQDYDILVISDYDKGFLTGEDISYLADEHDCVFLDTKKILHRHWAEKVAYIKINDYEYNRSHQAICHEAVRNKVIRTLGEDGCEFQGVRYPVDKVEVRDVSGAGDTFLAGLVAKYAETENIEFSIKFANQCASEVVKHRGVTVV
jgi:D-beta-D-heptose 7-phosphate kinase/D-beta-D-heptose 1-phosphate adenosyltransferase